MTIPEFINKYRKEDKLEMQLDLQDLLDQAKEFGYKTGLAHVKEVFQEYPDLVGTNEFKEEVKVLIRDLLRQS